MEGSPLRPGAEVAVASSRKKVLMLMIAMILIMTMTTTGFLIYEKIKENISNSAELTVSTQMTSSQISSLPSPIPAMIWISSKRTSTLEVKNNQPPTQSTSTETISSSPTKVNTLRSTEHTTIVEKATSAVKVVTNQPPTHSTSTESISSSPTKVHALQSTEQTTTDDKSTSCLLQSSSTNGTGDSPQDCSSINSGSCVSGSYDICLDGQEIDSVPIYCECTTEGIWTVIQKRFDGSVDFYRNWTDYKEGFGEVSGEYWLGNDIIHQLTSRSKYALKFVLTDWDNVTKYARYNRFEIADEAGRYRLSIGGYSGDAGNSVENHHDGRHFTTKDRDNDALYTGDNCAVRHTGAWWYGQCYDSNLNGPYRFGPTIPNGAGIIWRTWHGPRYSLKATKMMIRKA